MGSAVIADNFLDDFDTFRRYVDKCEFSGEVNPLDGVLYPGISTAIPDHIRAEIIYKLSRAMGCGISAGQMFMRLSVAGTDAPHQAHNDLAMGQMTAILYLNRVEHCQGGTELVRHKDLGMEDGPLTDDLVARWQDDHSNPDAWDVVELAEMYPNRIVVFESKKMHRAAPIGGFGSGPEDGRLILGFFFTLGPR